MRHFFRDGVRDGVPGSPYAYPGDLDVDQEFERPQWCDPEATEPYYPFPDPFKAKDFNLLNLTVVGDGRGTLDVVPDASISTVEIDVHFHTSNRELQDRISVEGGMMESGAYRLFVQTPRWNVIGRRGCVVVAMRVRVPAMAFEDAAVHISVEGLAVNVDLPGERIAKAFGLASRSGSSRVNGFTVDGKVDVQGASGSIHATNINADDCVMVGHSGSLRVEDVVCTGTSKIDVNSGSVTIHRLTVTSASSVGCSSGSVAVVDSSASSWTITAHSGSVRLSDIVGSGEIIAKSSSGSLHAEGVTGGFSKLDLSTSSGSVRVVADLVPEKKQSISATTSSASCAVVLREFYGTYHVEGSSVSVHGDGLNKALGNARRSVEGTRGVNGNATLSVVTRSGASR
ncbi:hypothetical protein HK101_002144, partial [Irineochytrium annulatum]